MEPIIENPDPIKQRHGCLMTMLVLMIILNSVSTLIYFFAGDKISQRIPGGIPFLMLMSLVVLGISNVIFSVMLLHWKKRGFYGFIITSIAALVINLKIGLSIQQSLLGLVGLAILYGVLQIKKDNVSGWENLE